jgi:hypothetical protein
MPARHFDILKLVCLIVEIFFTSQIINSQYVGSLSKPNLIAIEKANIDNPHFHSAFSGEFFLDDSLNASQRKIQIITDSWIGYSSISSEVYHFNPGVYGYVPLGKRVFAWCVADIEINKFQDYIISMIDSNNIIPGIGKYALKEKNTYFNPLIEGELIYKPIDYFCAAAGYGKKFWGNGYRSLWISDNASPYPYFQVSTNFWKIQYHIFWAYLKDIDNTSSNTSLIDKYGVFHFFDFKLSNRITAGFFESIIWWGEDKNTKRGIEVNYLNPVIFLRPVEYSIHSPDNANLGFNVSFRFWKSTYLYSQLFVDDMSVKKILDEPNWWGNKYGIQAGFKSYRLLGIDNLFFQSEFNMVRPYTYSHSSSSVNYGTMYQPLAHPLGANFAELLAIARYQRNNWQFFSKFIMAKAGLDTIPSRSFGQNIYLSYFYRYTPNEQATFLQGEKNKFFFIDCKISRIISRKLDLWAFAQFKFYGQTNEHITHNETIFQVGISTNFFNLERDF